ncbi:MAG: HAMP domain-containing protein [Rhizobiales bacterium]|nr:HAMP domain-containing protein [Hyphomicrobiales bacterium]
MTQAEFPSTIRYSLYTGLFLVIAILGLSVASSIWGLQRSAHYLERANHSYSQLAKVSEIESKINQYLLLEIANSVNFQNRAKLIEATPQIITQQLGDLQESIENEREFVQTTSAEDDIEAEVDTAIEIASVFIRMHLASTHEARKRNSLESADAVRSFFTNVVEGNDKKLSQVVRDIVKDEQGEVEEVKAEIVSLTKAITYTTGGLALLTTIGVIGLGLFLSRSIVGPVQILATGAEKVGAGELSYRIELPREDEFGLVANRFNKMAGQLENQQNLLRSANERLESAVIERTKELEDSNNRLRQIDETRRRFFSNVSHELRTPVTVLLGEAEVTLRSTKATLADMKKAMGRIVANGGFLRRRLNDLLNLARSDDGEIKLDLKEAVLNEIVEDAVSTANAYALANDVSLKYLAPKEDLIANLDESWFRQGILVLIDNAVKFSKPNDTIIIQVEEKADKALIQVIDQGPGIEEEALNHLFERYYQAKEGQKREGTGLGLAIAHWIITGHNGSIWAENVSQNIEQNEIDEKGGLNTGAIMNIEVELIE